MLPNQGTLYCTVKVPYKSHDAGNQRFSSGSAAQSLGEAELFRFRMNRRLVLHHFFGAGTLCELLRGCHRLAKVPSLNCRRECRLLQGPPLAFGVDLPRPFLQCGWGFSF